MLEMASFELEKEFRKMQFYDFLFEFKVGKSAIASQFLWEGFVSDYKPTVEEFNWVEFEMTLGGRLMLQVYKFQQTNTIQLKYRFFVPTKYFIWLILVSQLRFQIIDSSGSRDFIAMRDLYMRTADAFIVRHFLEILQQQKVGKFQIVFSVDDPLSFEEAKSIIQDIKSQRRSKVVGIFKASWKLQNVRNNV